MCLISEIFTDLNLLKLIHNKNIVCLDLDDANEIINMIDVENHYRIHSENRQRDSILIKIFSNQPLIKNIMKFIHASNRSWKGIDGWSIPHYIIRFGECELIEFMLNSFNFDLNIPNDEKYCPVHFAVGAANRLTSTNQLKIINLLFEQNIDLEVLDIDDWSPLYYLCSDMNNLDSQDQLEALRIIINKNVNLETPSSDLWYPIHRLSSDENHLENSDKMEAIKLLINKNVNLEIPNIDGWYPIHHISSDDCLKFENKEELFKIMMEKKVNFKVKTKDGDDLIDLIIDSNLSSKEKSMLIKMLWL